MSTHGLADMIAEKVASFPPLSAEQAGRIARLLYPSPAEVQVSEPIALEDQG